MGQQYQESLLHSEEFYRLLMENIKDYAIILLDPDAYITGWNLGAESILGYQAAEIVGQPGSCIFTPEDIDNQVPEQEVATATAAGRAEDERWHMRKDGTRFWASGMLMALRNETGQLRGFLKIVRDFTARKQAEAERVQLLEQAQAAQRAAEAATHAKDEFITVVAHELRNPLNAILGWTRLMRDRKLDEATLARALETIERNAGYQAQLVEDLLDLSRIVQGQLRLDRCSVSMLSVIEAAIETMHPVAEGKGVLLEITSWITAEVEGDPNRLHQVLCNLLANAVKFTPSGGSIQLQLECSGSQVQVQVKDTGVGIRQEFLSQVFEAFRQDNTTSSKSQSGIGIGLTIAQQLVELHGGTIQVESQEGQGATFTVTLPGLSQVQRASTPR